MTLDEEIKILEERAIEYDKLCERYDRASGYTRGHNEKIRTTDAKISEALADEYRQLAEWLKELKHLREKKRWVPVSERLPRKFEFVDCTCHSLIDDREDWVVETVYIPQPPNSPYSDWGNIPMLNSCECEVIAWMHRDIPEPYKAESEG